MYFSKRDTENQVNPEPVLSFIVVFDQALAFEI